ncbi:MAG: winged helix-turn-helix domain-containing protein [Candidatus Latescibacterota bacterium]|jgi:uncharacterized protein YcaQ
MRKISLAAARRLAIRNQGLDGQWELSPNKEGVTHIIEALGYVQIDTISVAQRAHDHIIWNRLPSYDLSMLQELLALDRRVFEYWTHAASYVPFADYRFYLARMRGAHAWRREAAWYQDNAQLVKEVLAQIRQRGALSSSDFEQKRGERGSWWGWKPAKRALEYLFNTGELMVSQRRKFQRVYDLNEHVVPPGTDETIPSPEESAHHFARRTLLSHGLASLPQLRKTFSNRQAAMGLQQLLQSGEAIEIAVENQKDAYYALVKTMDEAPRRLARHCHLLSPFDNLVIDRQRLEDLFGFHYRIECYTPAAKRQYGYFTLPLLWNGEVVARLDPKAERKTRTLLVRNLAFEPSFDRHDALLPDLARQLRAYAQFNNCDTIHIEKTAPQNFKKALQKSVS